MQLHPMLQMRSQNVLSPYLRPFCLQIKFQLWIQFFLLVAMAATCVRFLCWLLILEIVDVVFSFFVAHFSSQTSHQWAILCKKQCMDHCVAAFHFVFQSKATVKPKSLHWLLFPKFKEVMTCVSMRIGNDLRQQKGFSSPYPLWKPLGEEVLRSRKCWLVKGEDPSGTQQSQGWAIPDGTFVQVSLKSTVWVLR